MVSGLKQEYGVNEILSHLQRIGKKRNVEGMARYGIVATKVFGVPLTPLRAMARKIGRNHQLALQLWETGVHEARLLACLIDEPKFVTKSQMNGWTRDFENWAICDTCCGSLFDKTPYAYEKAIEWGGKKKEFVKRAGFALMAWLALHDKKKPEEEFLRFLPIITREAVDERNSVRKGVNWALRQIGKRSHILHKEAIIVSEEIMKLDSKSARWIATDALKELRSATVHNRLKKKPK